MRSAFSLLMFTTLAIACGDGEDTSEPGSSNPPATQQGFTSCGTVTCQPGQYCADAILSRCEAGCTSDVNCAANQQCTDPDFFNIGTCNNTTQGPVCGNGACEAGESAANCSVDCGGGGAVCGNGVCQAGENSANCAADCGSAPVCGNGICQAGETPANCAADCQVGPVCGNFSCETGESSVNCPTDCADPTGDCKEQCSSYDFFDCFGPGELTSCKTSCDLASDDQIEQFLNCNGAVFCDEDCFDFLP